MKILALATQKGGTGKSSIAVSLAVAAQERGLNVYVLDMDPQGTARSWFERRQAETPEVAALDASKLAAAIAALKRSGCDLLIIDTAGVDTPATTAAMQAAEHVLIPARPSVADLEAARPTVRALTKLGTKFSFILNQCPTGRTMRTTDAFRALSVLGVVAGTTLAIRADHVDALAQGLGVTERDPTGKAAHEVRELLTWTLMKMGGTSAEEKACVA
jgi:chromosome partitioning protein